MDSPTEPYIPIKQAEISIKKFNDVAIPHHLGLLKNHKSNIEKSLALGNWDKVKKEEINATRIIKQLKNLMLEMDILRGRVHECDLDKFDELTLAGRTKAKEAIKEFIDLQVKAPTLVQSSTNQNYTNENVNNPFEFDDLPQIQTEYHQQEHQLRSREACLAEFENLQREVEDIHELFFKLNGEVVMQKEDVEAVEENVAVARVDVEAAEKSLRQALKYKKAMYPLCGAVLGFCVAGPVGMVTFGLKAGAAAAVGCGLLGATGGVALKNKEEPIPMIEASPSNTSTEPTEPNTQPNVD